MNPKVRFYILNLASNTTSEGKIKGISLTLKTPRLPNRAKFASSCCLLSEHLATFVVIGPSVNLEISITSMAV